jgi:hypothetical protein
MIRFFKKSQLHSAKQSKTGDFKSIGEQTLTLVGETLMRDDTQAPMFDQDSDPFVPLVSPAADRLETFFYLTPVIGLLPSIWAIYRRQRNQRQLAVCRLSILLTCIWLSTYLSLNVGADLAGSSTSIGFRLLFINSLATSSYFIASLWLMMLLWQNKSLRLPGFSTLAEQTIVSKTDLLMEPHPCSQSIEHD